MSHLSIRMTPQDENNLAQLKDVWHVDRSEATRRALAMAIEQIKSEVSVSKEELLKESKFIGSVDSLEVSSFDYKKKLKTSLKGKYGIQ